MYKIIGVDGKEYGPVSSEQLRQWLAEGRVNGQTQAQAAGSATWQPLAAFPEFANSPAAAPPPVVLPAKTSGMAIASLVLGILGLVSCGLTALPGLILGIVGLQKIKRSGGRLSGNGLAVAGISVSGAMLFILPMYAAIMLPALSNAREKARRVNCASNLRQVGLALAMYADTNDGRLPPADRWADVLTNGVLPSVRVLHCPSAAGEGPSYAFNRNLSGGQWQGDASVGVLVEGGHGWNATVASTRELDRSPHRNGSNVLFNDGHVEWVPAERLGQLRWKPEPAQE